MDSKELERTAHHVFSSIENFYDKKICDVMDNNPNSFNLFPKMSLSLDSGKIFDENKMQRGIKTEFLPPICEKIGDFLRTNIPYETMLLNYDSIIRHKIHRHLSSKEKEIMQVAYNDPYIEMFDHIQMAPLHWVKFERFSNEDTMKVYKSLTTELSIPFGDDRFRVEPIHANSQFGLSDYSGIACKDPIFKTKMFSDEELVYKDVESKQVFMDARLGLMFYFKNKPCFFISYFIDFDMNVHIRQIQGLRKGRGHYVLGKEWQKEVVKFVKERFSFANEIRIITEDSAFEYLNKHYSDPTAREIVKDTLIKASSVYALFDNGKKIIEHNTSLMLGLMNKIELKEKYYTF